MVTILMYSVSLRFGNVRAKVSTYMKYLAWPAVSKSLGDTVARLSIKSQYYLTTNSPHIFS